MNWKIVSIPLAGFIAVYAAFDSFGTGKVATTQSAIELKDRVQDEFKPKFYPAPDSLGRSHEEHIEFMKRKHSELMGLVKHEAAGKDDRSNSALANNKFTIQFDANLSDYNSYDNEPSSTGEYVTRTEDENEIITITSRWPARYITKEKLQNGINGCVIANYIFDHGAAWTFTQSQKKGNGKPLTIKNICEYDAEGNYYHIGRLD